MSGSANDAVGAGVLFDVSGKVVLVTGGSRGIGNHIARGFVVNGARTYITARDASACEVAAQELSSAGECIALPADVATAEGRTALVESLLAREPGLDVLVNNAGAVWGAPFEAVPEHAYDKIMDLNVKATFLLIQSLLPALRKSSTDGDPGRVINIGSIVATRYPSPAQQSFVYPFSKAAVHTMTRHFALSVSDGSVTFNVIAPGYFETKLSSYTISESYDDIVAATPMKRLGSAEDVAGAALFLASRAGAFVNGAVLPVDGGAELGDPSAAL